MLKLDHGVSAVAIIWLYFYTKVEFVILNQILKSLAMLSHIIKFIFNKCAILGQNCILCGQANTALCQGCQQQLLRLPRPRCSHCAEPLAQPGVCQPCQKRPPAFDALYAPYVFKYPLNGLIYAFKYGKHLPLAGTLGALMQAFAAQQDCPHYDIVLPVPLARKRLGQRGFNQSEELARAIYGSIGSAFSSQLCWRKYNTLPQASLRLTERLMNVNNAFGVRRRCDNLCIAIVDDVATSGATLSALASSLKHQGAKRVDAWVLARAISS